MRFELRQQTTFTYDGPVVESQNEVRARPTSDHFQTLLHYHVGTEPTSRPSSHVDYWGTYVDTFGVRAPHERMVITVEATVETVDAADRPVPSRGVTMNLLEQPGFRDGHFEFTSSSKRIKLTDDLRALATEVVGATATTGVTEQVRAVHNWVSAELTYTPGATVVGSPLSQVLEGREGVCQDYAHLAVALCRARGIPARYVSGYISMGADPAGKSSESLEVVGKTHAWFEAAIPGHGWLGLDPTNAQDVGPRHIVVGRGRDYDDVAPVRGTYVGSDTVEVAVEVRLRRLGLAEQQQQQQQ